MAKKIFNRRYYHSLREFFGEFWYLSSHRQDIRRAMRESLSPAFRERLMMVVTEVNGCRYCSYYHAEQSLKYGLSEDELKELLAGSIPADTPPEEYFALTYAQHWADKDACPDENVRRKLYEEYGEETADAIEIALRMIRMGNLSGNTYDYVLFCLTFGRFGLLEDENRYGLPASRQEE